MMGSRLPRLIEYLVIHLGIGLAVGVAVSSLVLWTDLMGLKRLIVESQNPVLPLLLYYVMNALTFGSAAMGVGIMRIGKGEPQRDLSEPDYEPPQPK